MSKVGDQEVPKWVAYNHRDELVRAIEQIKGLKTDKDHYWDQCEILFAQKKALKTEIENLQAVVDAAIVYVHATQAAHHGPYSNQKKKAHRNLLEEVAAYEENLL